MLIPKYPNSSEITLEMRDILHPQFKTLTDGISEFTFANIYLFRQSHNYRISEIEGDNFVITGSDAGYTFFMLPFQLPDAKTLSILFANHHKAKCVSAAQVDYYSRLGYKVEEDRDNFDYLYSREDMVALAGRKFHKKKNLLNLFIKTNRCQAKPLLEEYIPGAFEILENWKEQQDVPGDYAAAREALENMDYLQLCGGIFYIADKPAAYCLGEEIASGTTYAIHFEKAVVNDEQKGIYQYINQVFAAILPEQYEYINREQDMGDLGLRQAKESYNPIAFVKKFNVFQ